MSMSINGTSGLTFNDGSTQPTAANGNLGFRNRIINGAMMIDQRNAGASVTPTNGQYLVDRWRAYLSQASKFTAQQSSTAPSGFVNSLVATSSSAYTVGAAEYFLFAQPIEGLNVSDLGWGAVGASTVTLSFQVRSSLTGTFGGALGNSAGDRSYPFSYTISSANTWETKSITIAGDTTGTWLKTNGTGLVVYLSLGSGSSVSTTANSWASGFYTSATGATSVVGTNGATFYITGVQLEKGSTATSFDYRPYGTELQLCQRYFESSYPIGTAVGTASSGSFYQTLGSDASNNASTFVKFTVPKRASPTMTGYQGATASTWNYTRSGATGNATVYFADTSSVGSTIYLSIGAAYVIALCQGDWSASSEL